MRKKELLWKLKREKERAFVESETRERKSDGRGLGEGEGLAETGVCHKNVCQGEDQPLSKICICTVYVFQAPSLGEIRTQFELYTYLKDGTELCRMIGLLTRQRVLDGIIYRPNNISSLEEKNVSLFINFVETEFKMKSIFGAHGPQVFHKFANFFVVLSGLARLSREIQRKF